MWARNTTEAVEGGRGLKGISSDYRRPRRDSSKRTILFLAIFLLLAVCVFASVSRGAEATPPDARKCERAVQKLSESYQGIAHTIVQLFRRRASVFLNLSLSVRSNRRDGTS
jgi:hypothetical protein